MSHFPAVQFTAAPGFTQMGLLPISFEISCPLLTSGSNPTAWESGCDSIAFWNVWTKLLNQVFITQTCFSLLLVFQRPFTQKMTFQSSFTNLRFLFWTMFQMLYYESRVASYCSQHLKWMLFNIFWGNFDEGFWYSSNVNYFIWWETSSSVKPHCLICHMDKCTGFYSSYQQVYSHNKKWEQFYLK